MHVTLHWRGVTIYNHVADIGLPFAHKVISTNDREALHVIDALENHETDLNIKEHYTDTAGFTDHVFALTVLLVISSRPESETCSSLSSIQLVQ